MLNILFFILKLIGIILASILGILIVLLLIVLFVPIRYRIDGEKYDTISLEAKIGWLLRILYCHILYYDDKLSIKFSIFGRLFYDNNNDNLRNKKVKKHKKKNKVSKHKAKSRTNKNDRMLSKESNSKTIPNSEQPKLAESGNRKESDSNMESDRHVETDRNMESDRRMETESNMGSDRHRGTDIRMDYMDSNSRIESDNNLESNSHMKSDSHMDSSNSIGCDKHRNYDKVNRVKDENLDNENEDNHNSINKKTKRTNKKTKRFFRKLKQIVNKIKHFFIKLKEKIINIINSIKNIKSKITELWNKWEKIKAFFNNETNKAGIKKIWISIKKLVKHIYPTKLKIKLEFGTGDPCDTGQALGVAAAFYGYYGKSIKITPNFETEIFEGTLYCKGRIRLFTLLIISIKLILDKNFRKLIQNFNSIKEEL